MKVQDCATGFSFNVLQMDWENKDPQLLMIKRQIDFQCVVGGYDRRLRDNPGPDLGAGSTPAYCLPQRTIHHLDMAVQECSEAWDMVEGGWKHHKTKPTPADPGELLMELVDVLHFVINAYIFMGGQPEAELVAASVARGANQIRLPRTGLDHFWSSGTRLYESGGKQIDTLYGHGKGSYGADWEAVVATRLNFLRQQITDVASALRHQITVMNYMVNGFKFPPASGYVYLSIMPALCATAEAIPGVTIDHLYAAFMHKNDINFERQKRNY